jgi:uncharacterized membrane protein HdeD (DUF308 family)
LQLVRSSILVVFALAVAFTPNHSAQFGLITFGVLLLVLSVSTAAIASAITSTPQAKSLHWWHAIVGIVVGALALALNQAGVVFLLWTIVLWGVLTGAAELVAGWRMPRTHTLRRDWMVQGSMVLLLALAVLFQSADSVAVVGFLGAWAVIQGVYGIIAGLSDRWSIRENQGVIRA